MAYVIWINLMEIYYIHTKELNYSAQNWKITWEKISVKLKKILRAIFSVQTLVLLLGRSCCTTHIYCITSEKHHKTSQVEKSHTQYKWPKQNDLIMGWIMYDAHHNRKLISYVNFTKILTKIVQRSGWILYDIGWNRIFSKEYKIKIWYFFLKFHFTHCLHHWSRSVWQILWIFEYLVCRKKSQESLRMK